MSSIQPFILCDCSLVRRATGVICSNLRDLLEAVRAQPDGVLEHHMMRCALDDYFELYEFPNDLARWCWSGLGDHLLGEQIGLVDPYREGSIASLRSRLVDLIEERLWGLERVPWCRPGLELPMVESRLVAYESGERIPSPAALVEAVEKMPGRSLFFHFHEARRRTGGRTDDFSLWLEDIGAGQSVVEKLRELDFYFMNLTQLRKELLHVFEQHLIPTTAAER